MKAKPYKFLNYYLCGVGGNKVVKSGRSCVSLNMPSFVDWTVEPYKYFT